MLRIVAETICGRRQLTMACADPEGGGRGPDLPWKITSSIGLYRDEQLDPPSWKKLDPPGKSWTALSPGILENCR